MWDLYIEWEGCVYIFKEKKMPWIGKRAFRGIGEGLEGKGRLNWYNHIIFSQNKENSVKVYKKKW